MADFRVGEVKTAVANFQDVAGVTRMVEGAVTWACVPDGVVTFDPVVDPASLRAGFTMASPAVGFIISATADANLKEGPENMRPLTIFSEAHNILLPEEPPVPEAEGGAVLVE